jgi:hypothetical protein
MSSIEQVDWFVKLRRSSETKHRTSQVIDD